MQAKIHLKNLKVNTFIGVRAHEKLNKQPLVLELTLSYSIDDAVSKDHLKHTVDYSKVCTSVIEYVESSRFHLLETLGVELAKQISQEFSISSVLINIQKPFALKELADVSFEYFHKA